MLAADSKGTSCLAVSPNRRWLAVAEQGPGKGTVSIYDLAILKKRKVLTPQEGGAKVHIPIALPFLQQSAGNAPHSVGRQPLTLARQTCWQTCNLHQTQQKQASTGTAFYADYICTCWRRSG